MHREGKLWRPDIADPVVRASLPQRANPYWKLIRYGRHLGLRVGPAGSFWIARIRTTSGGYYRQKRLGTVDELSLEQAENRAVLWFDTDGIRQIAAVSRPVGSRRELLVSPLPGRYSVAHALHEYVEWKRLAAAQSHFETNLSLINHHIVPRLSNHDVEHFGGEDLRVFVKSVLESAPKRGNQPQGPTRGIGSLEAEQLRKRKKTVNTLIGILRVAFQMAWENGKLPNDRPARSLRRLPAVDRPRVLHLSRPECRELLQHCRPDLRRLVLAALYTGCRASELVNLKCGDVGRDGYGIYVAPSKNYRPRFVFLPDEAMVWFLDLAEGRSRNAPLLLRDSGKRWFGNQKHLFKAAVRSAGLPEEFTFHGLRHTYASQLIQAGATVYAVADQLGHADPTTVLRTYGHLSPQIRESEVRQRFTSLSGDNAELARLRTEELTAWRSSLHGSDWRAYAQIADIRQD